MTSMANLVKFVISFSSLRIVFSRKEWIICMMVTIILFIIYLSELGKLESTCEEAYQWTPNLPNLSSLANKSDVFIPPAPSCSGSPLLLVIIVCSAAPNFAARQAIRATWGSAESLGKGISTFFLVGRSQDAIADSFVFEERLDYSDVIHYNLTDTYFNLTLKSVLLLSWAKRACHEAKYVMKVDDDTYVNVAKLRELLSQWTDDRKLVGSLIENAPRTTDVCSKWFVPRTVYPKRFYPNYLSGSGYVMSRDASRVLLRCATSLQFFPFEDIFITGVCAKAIQLTPENHEAFSYLKPKLDVCTFRNLATAHRVSPREHMEMWRKMNNSPPKDCSHFVQKLVSLFFLERE